MTIPGPSQDANDNVELAITENRSVSQPGTDRVEATSLEIVSAQLQEGTPFTVETYDSLKRHGYSEQQIARAAFGNGVAVSAYLEASQVDGKNSLKAFRAFAAAQRGGVEPEPPAEPPSSALVDIAQEGVDLVQGARDRAEQFRRDVRSGEVASATAYLRPLPSKAAFHGLAGEVALVLSEQTGADPVGILLVFLTMLGNAVGPEPHVLFGFDRQSARLFVLIVGDAATGGKGTILAAVERLFAEADPDWYLHRTITGLQSPEAMIEQVADGPTGDCRLLIVEPEYARLVSRMAASGSAFSAQLRNAYDGRPLGIARRGRNDGRASNLRASHAHISLIGEITPHELRSLHGRLTAAGGLETRFLYALVARRGEVNPFTPASERRDSLVERLRTVIEFSRTNVMERTDPISHYLCLERGVQPSVAMPVTVAVREGWPSIRAALPVVHDDYRSMTRRAETHVFRLAIAYAIADGAKVVTQVHIGAAMALWSYCAQSAERIFATPTGGLPPKVDPKRRGQLFEYLHRCGTWVPRAEIMGDGLFHNNLRKADFDAIVTALDADGLIEARTISGTGGTPRTEYRIAPTP